MAESNPSHKDTKAQGVDRSKLGGTFTGDQDRPADYPLHISKSKTAPALFYEMKGPFLVTLEVCSGTEPDDFVNFVTASNESISGYRNSYARHLDEYTHGLVHFHNYYEFLIVLDGCVRQKIEGKEYLYPEGSCCLINRELRHTELFTESSRALFIGLSADLLDELLVSYRTAFFKEERVIKDSLLYHFVQEEKKVPGRKAYLDFTPVPLLQNAPSCLQSFAKSDSSIFNQSFLYRCGDSLLHELFQPQFGSTARIRSILSMLIRRLTDPAYYKCSDIELEYNSDYLLFSRIRDLMETYNGRISRSELQNLLHYNGDYLNSVVNKYTNKSIFDYGMTFCMKKAAQELISTDKSISEIIVDLHFSNRTHFYSIFEETYGMKPLEYRKNYKTQE